MASIWDKDNREITVKSGTGNNYFEAAVPFDTMLGVSETEAIMSGLRKMQKDRMEWASTQQTTSK
jgi:hypothetical protein